MNFLLDPEVILLLLGVAAVLTPAAAYGFHRWQPGSFTRRPTLAFAALGPLALGFWFVHNLVLKHVGFDSIYSALIVVGSAAVVGLGIGLWSGNENRR